MSEDQNDAAMNGATALIETLADCGVELCIANPGTSEMHLVQALDRVPKMKSVLALFEACVPAPPMATRE